MKIYKYYNECYEERSRVVAALSKLFPSCLGKHDPNDKEWDQDWLNIVYIDLPAGQVSWHIADDHKYLFKHLEYDNSVISDGHTTEEKYKRLHKLPVKQGTSLKTIFMDWFGNLLCFLGVTLVLLGILIILTIACTIMFVPVTIVYLVITYYSITGIFSYMLYLLSFLIFSMLMFCAYTCFFED